jgi:hypothetical protein
MSANAVEANEVAANEVAEQIDYLFAARFVAVYEKICAFQGIDLDFTYLSSNPLITMAYVNKHPKKPWCSQGLTSNPSIPLSYMEAHPEKQWQPDEYHFRKYGGEEIEPEEEEDAGEFDGDLTKKNTPLAFIEEHMNWIDVLVTIGYNEEEETDEGILVWQGISDNANLTLEFLEKYYQKPWDHFMLANNPLKAAKAQFKKEYLAAYTIQQAYARAKYIPTYAYCRKLHLQFYEAQYGVA